MRLRTFMILAMLALFTIVSLAASAMPWQHKPKADAITGEWDAVLFTEDDTRQLTLKLKLEGNNVTGSFESSHLGSGAIQNGSWANNKLKITVETSHAPVTLTGTLQR
jgi:hypothetical protein